MSDKLRTSIKNVSWGVIGKIIVLIGQFLTRTLIIKVLGAEYLGLNSLFISLLQVLNLSELGLSSAIIYCLYKPIAIKDADKICALLGLLRKLYRYVGLSILLIGLFSIPFLPYLIRQNLPGDINIYLLYIPYLLNASISYFLFSYKSALLTAYQRLDLVNKVFAISQLAQCVFQVVALLVCKNLYVFVCVTIICTILNNILIEFYSRKLFPQYICKGNVSRNEKREIKKLVTGMMIQRICQTLRNSFTNICLSLFTTLTLVAVYGNYYFVLTLVVSFSTILTSAIQPVIGNTIATESVKRNYEDMNLLMFAYSWFAGFCFISLLCLYNDFMFLWTGKDLLLQFINVILFSLYWYVLSMGDIRALYHSAAGLWWHGKVVWLVEAVLNLILNLTLGYYFGITGILISIISTLLLVNFGFGSRIIFKYYFREYKVAEFYKRHAKYLFVTLIISVFTYCCTCHINLDGLIGLILKAFVCFIIPNILYYIIYRNNIYFLRFKKIIFSKFGFSI